jgi:single-stranded DNA-specific DHH superfamily exonuclease
MPDNKSQGVVLDNRGEEQPADKKRAQNVTSVEEKKKVEDEVQKTAEKSGF